jgi:hypothetical protein
MEAAAPDGELVMLSQPDLVNWALSSLSAVEIVDYTVDESGTPVMVEERVGVAAPVLEQVSAIWEALEPSAAERCAVMSADHAAYCPMTESEHRAALELQGFPAELHERVFQALTAIGLLQRAHSTALREKVVWAPYVMGNQGLGHRRLHEALAGERAPCAQFALAQGR